MILLYSRILIFLIKKVNFNKSDFYFLIIYKIKHTNKQPNKMTETNIIKKASFALTNTEPTLKGDKRVISNSDYLTENLRITLPVKFTGPKSVYYRLFLFYALENGKEVPLMLGCDSDPKLWSWGCSYPKDDEEDASNSKDKKTNVNMNLFFLSENKQNDPSTEKETLESQKELLQLFERVRTDIWNFIIDNKDKFVRAAPEIEFLGNMELGYKELLFKNFFKKATDKDKGIRINTKLLRGGATKAYKFFSRFYNKNGDQVDPIDYMYLEKAPCFCNAEPVIWFDNIYFVDKFMPQLKLLEATVDKLESTQSSSRLIKKNVEPKSHLGEL